MLKRHPYYDKVVGLLSLLAGGVMTYFSSIKLYTYMQTGEIIFRPRLGSASFGAEAAAWYAAHLLLGLLCMGYGLSVLLRR
ncbi:hypothetical protein ASF73_05530 [Xanthomonas sp. Leaf131]|nr:hypothetical protein ASF73_05530 [Xanthomonas sp. Leaf131]